MKKRLAAALISCIVTVSGIAAFSADYRVTQEKAVSSEAIHNGNAGIIFSEIPVMQNMTFEDGRNEDRYSVTYSEQASFKDVPCRQVYVENYFYMKLSRDFAAKDDCVFELSIDYWDYGGGGSFYVEYTTDENGEYKRIRVPKLGLDENGQKTEGTWFRATVYIDDACFTGSMDYDSDFRIISNAYNAFSRLEIRNLSKTAGSTEDFGAFNERRANVLNYLGMFDGFGEGDVFESCLDKKLTREEFIVQMIKSYNLGAEALEKNISSSFSDVSDLGQPYVGLAEKMGLLHQKGVLGANEYFTQNEMFVYYLRLLGADEKDLSERAFEYAKKYGLNTAGSMIFQPEKEVTVDSFVVPALNIFSKANLKTGTSPFSKLFEAGVYSEATIVGANDDTLTDWLLTNEFKIEPEKHTDSFSGRTYYTLDFLGKSAMKEYYTQNCMSIDCKRLYFRDENMRIYEYNLETNLTRYIGTALRDYNYMVTPKNNLWYTNDKWQIVKLNLDTYESEIMDRIPEWQTQKPFMMQVNNAETRISYEWFDTKGEFDANYFSRIPIYNLETREWDLRFGYGFDTEWYRLDHQCINPVYNNYALFAHEGYAPNGSGQVDRVWVVNMDTNEYYNVFKQKYYSRDRIGETATHEAWSSNGEWLLSVTGSSGMDGILRGIGGTQGVVMMRPDGTDKRYIPADYTFTWRNGGGTSNVLHCMLGQTSDRWIVGDSSYGRGWSDLYLIDNFTGKSYFLARLNETGSNPGHIHPQFSPDDNTVIFGLWSADNRYVQVGWMDVSDIVNDELEGGNYDLSDSCDTFGYKGFEHYIIPNTDENGALESFTVPKKNEMYVNVKREVIETDNTPAEISVTYLDKGYSRICLSYLTWQESVGGMGKLTRRKKYIELKNSGKVKNHTFKFSDICLGNMDVLGTDMRIRGVNSDVVIYSVEAKIPENGGGSK